ncbi:restriction endonuclease [Spirosoma sp. SC4-14]|uniref:restriction endonuclease n=1 Tax=Spirosoma sp. SC4-14 TaxID=3128900 RepID=UPI0030CE1079
MPNVYCVRAMYGQYTSHFLQGAYVAIGWLNGQDLSQVNDREEIRQRCRDANPQLTSNLVLGQQAGQVSRFLFDIKPGDYVITPAADTSILHYGQVEANPYFLGTDADGCPFTQRKRVRWSPGVLRRSTLSIPMQNTLGSSLTVFQISNDAEFFEAINRSDLASPVVLEQTHDHTEQVLKRLLELDPTEFELLIMHLLTAIGFEAQHTGQPHDGGVDVRGLLNVANMARIQLIVQVKRYQLSAKISAREVKALRSSIPAGAQGAFVTTATFHSSALDIATEAGFPRIGTVNGRQLVDLLTEHWADIPDEFKERLHLKVGLILA